MTRFAAETFLKLSQAARLSLSVALLLTSLVANDSFAAAKKHKTKSHTKKIVATSKDAEPVAENVIKKKSENEMSGNSIGVTSMMSAVASNDVDGVRFFSKSDRNLINRKNLGGATALHIACRNSNVEIVKILLEAGADPDIGDNEGWTPTMRAALTGNQAVIDLLLAHGGNPSHLNLFDESAIMHATMVDCMPCLESMFSKFDFVRAINLQLLNDQINNSFLIAKNRDNQPIQKLLESYLDNVVKKASIVTEEIAMPQPAASVSPGSVFDVETDLNPENVEDDYVKIIDPSEQAVADKVLPQVLQKETTAEVNSAVVTKHSVEKQPTSSRKYVFKQAAEGRNVAAIPEVKNIPAQPKFSLTVPGADHVDRVGSKDLRYANKKYRDINQEAVVAEKKIIAESEKASESVTPKWKLNTNTFDEKSLVISKKKISKRKKITAKKADEPVEAAAVTPVTQAPLVPVATAVPASATPASTVSVPAVVVPTVAKSTPVATQAAATAPKAVVPVLAPAASVPEASKAQPTTQAASGK